MSGGVSSWPALGLSRPGLFVTATDTAVGKTVVTCAIAAALRAAGHRVGVSKPIASGCRHERIGLVNEDAEALAHFADCMQPLATINPVRYAAPLAPAAAAERAGRSVNFQAIADSWRELDAANDVLLVEGVGGVMVPLDEQHTVLDLARWLGFPVLVVTRAGLGTLNHTALTCGAIHAANLPLAGLVINRYDPESADLSVASNPRWLTRQNQTPVLATLPCAEGTDPARGRIAPAVLEAVAGVDWSRVLQPRPASPRRP